MKYLFLLGSSLLAASPAVAENGPDAASSILVTGSSVPVEQAGQSVSVIGAEELARVQGPDLMRALERLPGVVFARSGPLGGQ
ncbi:MAG: TonB-dependent receptor, partial [Novosphingobium sp.]|nr:TonB-dependent receptor [Novosphingobium sp.]